MKQETKDKLKNSFKVVAFIGAILLWIVSFIGVSAYSVYWISANDNIQEPSIRDLSPKSLVKDDNFQSILALKEKSFLSQTLNYNTNTNNYKDYWDVDFNNFPQEDTSANFSYFFLGDFSFRVDGTENSYSRLQFSFTYHAGGTYIDLTEIFASQGSSSIYLYSRSADVYRGELVFKIGEITSRWGNHIVENSVDGLITYYFREVFNYNDAYKFTFDSGPRNLPQYLSSYNRLQYGQIQYSSLDTNTDSLTIPMVFVSNGTLYDNITILLRPCWYYYNSAGQIVDNWAITPTGTLVSYVCTYVLFGYYGKTLNWTYDSNNAGVLSSVVNGSMAMFLGYNGFSYQDDVNPAFWAPNYLVVQGLQVNTDYQDIYVMNTDTIPFPNYNGTNLKPYNNISIKDILVGYFNFYGEVNGYNGNAYDVGLGNVFTLLSDAFKSLIPLFAIQIIPGITLGLLVLLPLVVTIILVILKLVKK